VQTTERGREHIKVHRWGCFGIAFDLIIIISLDRWDGGLRHRTLLGWIRVDSVQRLRASKTVALTRMNCICVLYPLMATIISIELGEVRIGLDDWEILIQVVSTNGQGWEWTMRLNEVCCDWLTNGISTLEALSGDQVYHVLLLC
jgi:hypothetical protein